jgi:peptide/nickel transport system permease protein
LPAFWVAVLLKEFLALKFNAFLKNPILSLLTIIIVACVIGILCFLLSVGKLQKRLIICGAGIIISIIILFYISFSKWFSNPYFGYIGSVIIIGGLGFGILTIMAGNENKKANLSALTFFIVLIVGYMPLQYIFVEVNSLLAYVLVAVIVILIGVLIGFLYGGDDKNISMKTNGVIGFVAMLVLFVDQLFQYWSEYYKFTNGNPIATISQSTPNFAGAGNFWLTTMDTFTHSVLPTIALLLISFAAYTRYTRSSMLDVMNQDYIRTARAKGLNERTVIFRHAFRNALLPLATIVPLDLAGILGGAIITEKVFGWHGMGTMFLDSVSTGDFNGVMGYFLVIAVFAIIATIVADILYAILDPRIRIDS